MISSIINDIVKVALSYFAVLLIIKKNTNDGIRHLQKYQIEINKIPSSTFPKKFEYPIKICSTQMNEKGVGNILNY